MASIARAFGDSLKRLFFRELTVLRVVRLSESFERVDFVSEALRGARFSAGDKLQIMSDGGPRTYTPFAFDATAGTLSVLIYFHGDGPSRRWGQSLLEGARAHALGPRGSLALASETGSIALFGDETSFGLARALFEARGSASGLGFAFEVSDAAQSQRALEALAVPNVTLVQRSAGDAHLPELEGRLRTIVARDAATRLVLTGNASSIQTLRKRLKAEPIAHAGQLVKAYWAPGKRGLD